MKYNVRVWVHCARGSTNCSKHFRMTIIPGTVPVMCLVFPVRTCQFRRNSSNLDNEPIIRLSLLLNSWDVLSVTLLSISSEVCVIYSSLNLDAFLSLNKLFLGKFSWLSVMTAANFHLFFNVDIDLKNKSRASKIKFHPFIAKVK